MFNVGGDGDQPLYLDLAAQRQIDGQSTPNREAGDDGPCAIDIVSSAQRREMRIHFSLGAGPIIPDIGPRREDLGRLRQCDHPPARAGRAPRINRRGSVTKVPVQRQEERVRRPELFAFRT